MERPFNLKELTINFLMGPKSPMISKGGRRILQLKKCWALNAEITFYYQYEYILAVYLNENLFKNLKDENNNNCSWTLINWIWQKKRGKAGMLEKKPDGSTAVV